MKGDSAFQFVSIAWQYPGQELELIPAFYSRMTRPGWPATCQIDLDCDDGVWCNGEFSYQDTVYSVASKL